MRRWGFTLLLCGVLSSGCYRTTVSVQEQRVLVSENRELVSEERPVAPVWHFRNDAIVGQLRPLSCETTRVWRTTRERVTELRPNRALGLSVLGLGVASSVAGLAMYDSNLYLACEDTPQFNGIQPRQCQYQEADNSVAKAFLGVGLLAELVGGAQLLFLRPDVRVETLSREEQPTEQIEPCLSPRDSSQLLLVLRSPSGQLWPVRMSPGGVLTIALPGSPPIPRGVDLKLVVYRAPNARSGLLQRGQVLDSFQLSDE